MAAVSPCENLIPQSDVAELYAKGYAPREGDGSSHELERIFVENGGLDCVWIHPNGMDGFPYYAYSKISPEQTQHVQTLLLEQEQVRKDDKDGFVVFGNEYGGPGVYLFGEGVWIAAYNLEEAFLVVDAVLRNRH